MAELSVKLDKQEGTKVAIEPVITFTDLAEEVLKSSDRPLTYQEIWEVATHSGLTEKLGSRGKTPVQTLGARLYIDVRDNAKSRFLKVGANPARFFLKSRKSELTDELLHALVLNEKDREYPAAERLFRERDLHPLLAYFVYSNPTFNRGRPIYTKTIYHERSKHSEINEWTHPDMVGFHMPIDVWNKTVLDLSKIVDRSTIKFYSFELKRQISRQNYREYFFQAVSNSSWAHEGYLVASQVQQRDDLLSELDRLSSAFGIGIIRLDLEDIDSSEVIFPAKERDQLDWELMNKLSEQNDDFERFLDDVRKDYEVNTIHDSEYDEIISEPVGYAKKLIGLS